MTAPFPVEIVAYSEVWPLRFAAERRILAAVLPPSTFRIEHIGSTSVRGLAAKPIIDVLIGARALVEIETRISALEALGYQYIAEHESVLPQRRYFAKPARHPTEFHLHAVELDSLFWTEHLLFRDLLRTDAGLAAEYLSLKLELAARHGADREGYADAKGPFIRSVLQRARLSPIRSGES